MGAPALRTFAAGAAAQFDATQNYYAHLGLKADASAELIKKQFYVMAKKHHPDAVGDCPKNEEIFKKITAAYEVLSNADSRKQYDSARLAQQQDGTSSRNPFSGRPSGSPGFGYQAGASDDWNDFMRQNQ